MVQLSNGGTAFSCRTWCGPLRRAEDLRNRRNGRRSIEENKGMYNCWSFTGIGAFLFSARYLIKILETIFVLF